MKPAVRQFKPVGHLQWVIPEGYIPKESHGPQPEMLSHETACILNVSDQEAHVELWIFYSDQESSGPYRLTVGPRRAKHVRFNDLKEPVPIPRGKDYASMIESDVPIVV